MREQVHAFLESAIEAFELDGPIYEFGYSSAEDAAGAAESRNIFPLGDCFGDELDDGAKFDPLDELVKLPIPDDVARTVVCSGVLGHVFEPQRAVKEMIRILVPGGILLVCEPVGGSQSERRDRYWGITPQTMQWLLGGLKATLVGWQGAEELPHTVFGIASKPPANERFLRGTGPFLDGFQQRLDEAAAHVGWWKRLKIRLTTRASSADGHRGRRDFYQARFVVNLPVDRQLKHHLLQDGPPAAKTGTRIDLHH